MCHSWLRISHSIENCVYSTFSHHTANFCGTLRSRGASYHRCLTSLRFLLPSCYVCHILRRLPESVQILKLFPIECKSVISSPEMLVSSNSSAQKHISTFINFAMHLVVHKRYLYFIDQLGGLNVLHLRPTYAPKHTHLMPEDGYFGNTLNRDRIEWLTRNETRFFCKKCTKLYSLATNRFNGTHTWPLCGFYSHTAE